MGELWCYDPDGGEETETFAYQARYAEYRTVPNLVTRDMRGPLSFWNFAIDFETKPAYNQEFTDCNPRRDPFAVTDSTQDTLIVHTLHKIRAVRPIPVFGTPQL